jgi:hypothetical protein
MEPVKKVKPKAVVVNKPEVATPNPSVKQKKVAGDICRHGDRD